MYRDLSRTIKAYAPQGYMICTRVFAHIGVSSKGAEAKMGKSKGSIAYWCAKVYPGKLLFQIHGVSKATAAEGTRSIDRKTGYSLQLVCL
jgi:large subunit ribosomal protein L16